VALGACCMVSGPPAGVRTRAIDARVCRIRVLKPVLRLHRAHQQDPPCNARVLILALSRWTMGIESAPSLQATHAVGGKPETVLSWQRRFCASPLLFAVASRNGNTRWLVRFLQLLQMCFPTPRHQGAAHGTRAPATVSAPPTDPWLTFQARVVRRRLLITSPEGQPCAQELKNLKWSQSRQHWHPHWHPHWRQHQHRHQHRHQHHTGCLHQHLHP